LFRFFAVAVILFIVLLQQGCAKMHQVIGQRAVQHHAPCFVPPAYRKLRQAALASQVSVDFRALRHQFHLSPFWPA
jgi:hypothetical protein